MSLVLAIRRDKGIAHDYKQPSLYIGAMIKVFNKSDGFNECISFNRSFVLLIFSKNEGM